MVQYSPPPGCIQTRCPGRCDRGGRGAGAARNHSNIDRLPGEATSAAAEAAGGRPPLTASARYCGAGVSLAPRQVHSD